MDLALSRVQNGEGEHSVEHGGRLLCAEALVQVNDDLAVAFGVEPELVEVAQCERVVHFAVEEEPYVRVRFQAHRLHALREVVDLQPVETEQGMRNVLDRLDT